jgi:membrane protease YdiL (CAAX protease family)
MTNTPGESAHRSFARGVTPLVGVVVFSIALPFVVFWLATQTGANAWLVTSGGGVVWIAAAVVMLRFERASASTVGARLAHFVSGVAGVAVLFFAMNILLYAIMWAASVPVEWGFGGDSTEVWLIGAATQWLFTGPGEEFMFRGYIQNKLVAMNLFGLHRSNTALAILGASIIFAVMHSAQIIRNDMDGQAGAIMLAVTGFGGVLFGVVYLVTRNIFFCGFLHGMANHMPIFVRPEQSPAWWMAAMIGSGLIALIGSLWLYRCFLHQRIVAAHQDHRASSTS